MDISWQSTYAFIAAYISSEASAADQPKVILVISSVSTSFADLILSVYRDITLSLTEISGMQFGSFPRCLKKDMKKKKQKKIPSELDPPHNFANALLEECFSS